MCFSDAMGGELIFTDCWKLIGAVAMPARAISILNPRGRPESVTSPMRASRIVGTSARHQARGGLPAFRRSGLRDAGDS